MRVIAIMTRREEARMKDTKKPAAAGQAFDGFTDEERAAMKDHAREL